MYSVFALNKSDRALVEELLSDDVIGRQTIIQKDGDSLGYENKLILVVEGADAAVTAADKILSGKVEKLSAEKGNAVYNRIKEDEKNADSGMGFLFG